MSVPYPGSVFEQRYPKRDPVFVRHVFLQALEVVRLNPGWAYPASFETGVDYLLTEVFPAATDPAVVTLDAARIGWVDYMLFEIHVVAPITAMACVPQAPPKLKWIIADITCDLEVLLDGRRSPISSHLRTEIKNLTLDRLRYRGYL